MGFLGRADHGSALEPTTNVNNKPNILLLILKKNQVHKYKKTHSTLQKMFAEVFQKISKS